MLPSMQWQKQPDYSRRQTGQHSPSTNEGLAQATGGHVIWWHTILDSCHEGIMPVSSPIYTESANLPWHYLAGTLGAAVHNPVLFIFKQAAVLPAHVFLFWVLHLAKGFFHERVLLRLKIKHPDLQCNWTSERKLNHRNPTIMSLIKKCQIK